MKKIFFNILLGTAGVFLLTAPVLAATTISFSPAAVNVKTGQTFNLSVAVDPQGIKNYTVKLKINYPADLLEVKSFNFGNNWMALSQAGYDSIDNTNGVLIKTAGYPSGLNSSATFGTISFLAKKAGSGVIKTDSGSLALDANNQNVFSGAAQTNITIAAITTPPPSQTPKPKITTPPAQEPTPAAQVETPAEEMPIVSQEQPKPGFSLLAAIGNVLTLGTGNVWVGILVGLIILAIIVYVVYALIRKGRKNLGQM